MNENFHTWPSRPTLCTIMIGLLAFSLSAAEKTNLISNGNFEGGFSKSSVPLDWSVSGNSEVKQQLTVDAGHAGKFCAKLDCSEFADNGPAHHAMLCQVGKVGVRKGQWYRLSFWAKAKNLKSGAVEIALVNTRRWENLGLGEAVNPESDWKRFEIRFRAGNDLPAEASRLQFWFKSTGTVWFDDIELVESSEGLQWHPQISTDGVKNFVPNSSFECGTANWGSFTYGLSGWSANLYRLEGERDTDISEHGRFSFKIALNPTNLPVYYFDYYEPVRQPVRRVLLANHGWFRVQPGEKLTLSAYLRADAEGVVAQMAANEAPSRLQRKQVTVGTRWQRHEFTFAPSQSFLFIAVGLDLEGSTREAATLWIDSIQLERGEKASAYEPRQVIESFIETGVPGNLFTNVDQGAAITIRAMNYGDTPQNVPGKLVLTDFFDRPSVTTYPTFVLPAHGEDRMTWNRLCQGQRGFFRASWETATVTQTLRCAIYEPVKTKAAQSPIGFNHAYPWDFVVQLARQAGVGWWRDWSAKWQTVEPTQGQFDFKVPDQQIHRVLRLDGEVDVLLPFSSAAWSTTARADEIENAAGNNSYLRTRLPVAYAPKDWQDFGRYAGRVAEHYSKARPNAVTVFQILNEPLYTDYALPRKFGYTMQDYLRCLETGYRAIKAANPKCQVVGGLSANIESSWTRDFVSQNGLQFLDIFDLHLYDPPRPAESYDEPFRKLAENMRAHGGLKPIWITEWGCYADDDPPCIPHSVGDQAMNRCRWGSERAATEHIVKFTAVTFAHGLRKLFFHAGTCGTINCPDAGGVLFEYGGTPRKMLPGIAALSRLFCTPDELVQKVDRDGLYAYIFRRKGEAIAIAWRSSEAPQPLKSSAKVTAYDIMGNQLTAPINIGSSPIYILAKNPDNILQSLNP